jgi:ERF superfamily
MTMGSEAIAEIIPPPRRRAPAVQQAPLSDSAALLSAIEKAALNPQVDIGKVEQLLALYERIEGRRAEAAFNEALTAAQAAMRPVATDMENSQTRSRYASYAALDRVLRPIYTNAGFSLTFNTAPGAPEAHVRVTCNVTHRAGHVRTYTLDLPADGKGPKGGDTMSRTHATASALSYGMRYLLRLIFNIAVGEGDDDGNKAGTQEQVQQGTISAKQLAELRKLITDAKADTSRFCRYLKVTRLEDLPAARFQTAIAALEAKKAKAGA